MLTWLRLAGVVVDAVDASRQCCSGENGVVVAVVDTADVVAAKRTPKGPFKQSFLVQNRHLIPLTKGVKDFLSRSDRLKTVDSRRELARLLLTNTVDRRVCCCC